MHVSSFQQLPIKLLHLWLENINVAVLQLVCKIMADSLSCDEFADVLNNHSNKPTGQTDLPIFNRA